MHDVLKLLADDPIEEAAADLLDRRAFAAEVVNILRLLPSKDSSTVLALIGPWGSGKSSVLKLVTKELEQAHSEEWKVASFNPWEMSSLEGLMVSFFEAISTAIPADFKTKTRWDTFTGYASKALLFGGALKVPGASLFGLDPGEVAKVVSKLIEPQQSSQALRQRLEEVLKELPSRILVVIDDLDRLMPDELLMMFKLVRLLGRLPGIHYLLAYDEQTLLSVLKESQIARSNPDRALAYLEKIVQIRLDLPAVHERQARAMVEQCLREVLPELDQPAHQEEREFFESALEQGLMLRLNEPRSIKRYFAQVQTYLRLVRGRVYLPDYLWLTYLRTFYPTLYRELYRRKGVPLWTQEEGSSEDDSRLRKLLSECGVPSFEAEAAKELILRVFPWSQERWNSPSEGNARLKRAIHPAYFDRYFYFGVPPGDLSEEEVDKVVSSAREENAGDREKLDGWLEQNLDLIMPKLRALEPKWDDARRIEVLLALARFSTKQGRESISKRLGGNSIEEFSVELCRNLSPEAAPDVSRRILEPAEFEFFLGLIPRWHLFEGTTPGWNALMHELATRMPEHLKPLTAQRLSEVEWCLELVSYWGRIEGVEIVHRWMMQTLEMPEAKWRLEDLIGCCVPALPKPRSERVRWTDENRRATFTELNPNLLNALVPEVWALPKLKDALEMVSEPKIAERGVTPSEHFQYRVSLGLFELKELLASGGWPRD